MLVLVWVFVEGMNGGCSVLLLMWVLVGKHVYNQQEGLGGVFFSIS